MKKIYKPVILLAVSMFLISCSQQDGDVSQINESENSTQQSIPSIQQSSPSSNQTPQTDNSQSRVKNVTDISPPEIDTSNMAFTPIKEDILEALISILTSTAVQIPQSEERDAWYVEEVRKIDNMQVKSCTTVPLGTPSECVININGQDGRIKLLLTQRGWQIIQ